MWEAIMGILTNAVNMIGSGNADSGMISTIADQERKNVISPAYKQALNIYGEQANEGLAGKESLVAEEKTMLPTTLNEMKDAATSGQLMSTMTKLYSQQQKGLRQIGVADAQAKQGNKEKLAEYLSGPYAKAQDTQLSTGMNLALAKASAMMGKTKVTGDYVSSIGKGLGKLGDTDWSSIIALLSSGENTNNAISTLGGGASVDALGNVVHYDPNTGSWSFE
jgi:hypothetical protein